MTCTRRLAGMHEPVSRTDSPPGCEHRTVRRRARFSLRLALLLCGLHLFAAAPAEAQSPTIPTLPQNVQVTAGNAKLTLSWQAPSSWGTGVTPRGYEIDWFAGASAPEVDSTEWVAISPDLAASATSYTLTGTYALRNSGSHTVANGAKYWFRIRAFSTYPNDPSDIVPGNYVEVSGTPVAAQQTQSSDADLSGLTASSATSASGTFSALGLSPSTFAAATTAYTASVANARTHVKLTPTVSDSNATVAVRKGSAGNLAAVTSGSASAAIALAVGSNAITVRVTAQDSTTKDYTVTITRQAQQSTTPTQSSDADLSGLTASSSTSAGGTFSALGLSPSAFAAATTSYTATVPNTVTHMKLTPMVNDSNASVEVGKGSSLTAVTSGSASAAIALAVGSNAVTVRVTAQDSTTKDYTVTITRQAPAAPPGAPTNLQVSPGDAKLGLSWRAPSGGPAVAGYDVHYTASPTVAADAAAGSDVSAAWVAAAAGGGARAARTIAGLTNGTLYRVRVRATNGAGASAWVRGSGTPEAGRRNVLFPMWLSRFGRTVGSQVTDAVSGRLEGGLPAGAHATLAGQGVDLTVDDLSKADDGPGSGSGTGRALTETLTALARTFAAPGAAGVNNGGDPFARHGPGDPWPGDSRNGGATAATGARPVTGRELLLGSSFHVAGKGEGPGPGLAAWGRVAQGSFDGEEGSDAGRMSLDGEVLTGTLGADVEWNRLLAGVAVSFSEGEGRYGQTGVDKGSIESTMTTVSPYARFDVTERVSAWGLAGFGSGGMNVRRDARDGRERTVTKADLSMRMGAVGARGELLTRDEAGGMDLALNADAFFVRLKSGRAANSAVTEADASRVRLVLEGGRSFAVSETATVRPSLELGLRHDGGDAETGAGVEIGGGVAYTDAASGLSIEAKARMLAAHADSGYEEWGASAAARLDPGMRGRGLSFSLAPAIGAASSASERLWGVRDARGLALGGEFEAARGLKAEAGYGLGLFGDRFTGTPNLGFGMSDGGARDYRLGWRLTSAVEGDPGFEVSLDATRREAANDNGSPGNAEHGVMLRALIRR